MKKILSLRFSKAVETYDEWALPQRYVAQKLSEIAGYLAGSVLDVGCGTGMLSKYIKADLKVGIDISEEMAKYYSERFGLCVVGDAEQMPFKDKSFDWAFSSFTLHWTDLEKSIGEMLRVASKGIGAALPVVGSVEEFGFPFPEVNYVENILFKKGCCIESMFVEEVDIPFRGIDLIKFFHYTGSSYNPSANLRFSKSYIEERISCMTRSYFRVLFFLCKIKS